MRWCACSGARRAALLASAEDDRRCRWGARWRQPARPSTPYLDVVDSLLHMHCNRRGADREEEIALRRVLWKTLYGAQRRA